MKIVIPAKQQKIESFSDPLILNFNGMFGVQLSHLTLRGNSYSKLFCKEFAEELCRAENLKVLDLNDIFVGRLKNQIPFAIESLAHALTKINIVELDISNNALGPSGANALAIYLSAPNILKKLLINNCGLGIEGLRQITGGLGKGSLQLKIISIGRNRAQNEGAKMVGQLTSKLVHLSEIYIFQNNIRLEGMRSLLGGILQNLKEIEILDIQDNFLQKEPVQILCRILQKNLLSSLNISDCNIVSENNTLILAALEKAQGLRRLGYSYDDVSNQQALRLGCILEKRQQFVRLDCKGNDLKRKVRQQLKTRVKGEVNVQSQQQEEDISRAFSRLQV